MLGIGVFDFEHGHEPDVTVGVGCHFAIGAPAIDTDIEKGFTRGGGVALDLTFLVVRGPIEDVEGIPEMLDIVGTDDKLGVVVIVLDDVVDDEAGADWSQ